MTQPNEPRAAPHLSGLPRDERGFPVAAEVPWTEEGPRLSKVDPLMKLILAGYRACSVCGFAIPPGETAWRIYDHESRRTTHDDIGRQGSSVDNDVPGHRVCMLYSALICPFWRTAGGRLGKDSMFEPGARRGEAPAIMGFEDYSILIDPFAPFGGPDSQRLPILLEGYVDEIVFSDPLSELRSLYDKERIACGGRYVAPKRRHYAPQLGGKKRFTRESGEVVERLGTVGPDSQVDFEGTPVGVVLSGWMHR